MQHRQTTKANLIGEIDKVEVEITKKNLLHLHEIDKGVYVDAISFPLMYSYKDR